MAEKCRTRTAFNMSARSQHLRQLARKCKAAAAMAADAVTKARFEQERKHWLELADQAEEAERISPSYSRSTGQ